MSFTTASKITDTDTHTWGRRKKVPTCATGETLQGQPRWEPRVLSGLEHNPTKSCTHCLRLLLYFNRLDEELQQTLPYTTNNIYLVSHNLGWQTLERNISIQVIKSQVFTIGHQHSGKYHPIELDKNTQTLPATISLHVHLKSPDMLSIVYHRFTSYGGFLSQVFIVWQWATLIQLFLTQLKWPFK